MELDGEPTSPEANHLFEVDDNGIKLKPEQKDMFHEFVAKLLFLGKRARPDLQTAISFLSTRVREPDTEDYKKLIRLTKYLNCTKDIPLTLGADNSGCIPWTSLPLSDFSCPDGLQMMRLPTIGCTLNCWPPKLVEYPSYPSSISSALSISCSRQCRVLSLWLTEMK